jgi:hypothetical protein
MFFHTYPDNSDLDIADGSNSLEPPLYKINFRTSYTSVCDDGFIDLSLFKCTAHFASLADAYEWFYHYSSAITLADSSDIDGGVCWSMGFINGPNSACIRVPVSNDFIRYNCDYDHTYWNQLVVGEIDEFCKQ